jgi:hypothetical protein
VVIEVVTGAVVLEATIAADSASYERALTLVDEHAPGRRVFAIEGTGSSVVG